MRRLSDWLIYLLERLLLRGAHYRLMLMAAGVVGVSVAGGILLMVLGEPEGVDDAVWWAFLRLTDPGYLGDDEGVGRRALSTALTVLGYVLFMGALIAILTQWLHSTVAWLQRGETPLVMSGHLVVLGLTERTPVIVGELLRSESKVRRLLRIGFSQRLRIVVLVEELDEDLRASLATSLGDEWDDNQVILRSGSPLVEEHLARVDFAHALAIVIPGAQDVEASAAERDALTLKTVLSIARHPSIKAVAEPPRLLAEIADDRLLDVVHEAYQGVLVLLPTDTIASRLIAQNLRHRGLSWVLRDLLAFHTGNDLFFPQFPDAVGQPFEDAVLGIQHGLCLGLVRKDGAGWRPYLNPERGLIIEADDHLVVIGRSFEDLAFDGPKAAPAPVERAPSVLESWPQPRRVLVLGWGARAKLLLKEFETYEAEQFEVDVLSVIPKAERIQDLIDIGAGSERVVVNHLDGDYTNVRDIRALDLVSYDNLVILGRDWLERGASSDAHTILGALIVRADVRGVPGRPATLVELTDPDNARLFDDHPGEVILSPEVMGRMMAHATVRPEIHAVLDELFTVGGAEFHYRPPSHYGFGTGPVAFSDLQVAALARGELAVGVRVSSVKLDVTGDLALAPDPGDVFELSGDALMLVLTTYTT